MVPMKCGHKGKPNKSEEKLIENLMRDSEFILTAPVRNKTEVEKDQELKSSLIDEEVALRNSALSEDFTKNRIVRNMADEEDHNDVDIEIIDDSANGNKGMEEFDSGHRK